MTNVAVTEKELIASGKGSVSGAAVSTKLPGLSAALRKSAAYAWLQSSITNLHISMDGTAATTIDNFVVADGPGIWITSKLSDIRIIQAAPTAEVTVTYYRPQSGNDQ